MLPGVVSQLTGLIPLLMYVVFLDGCVDIMYNVDQQLFDYCTAKFADNTQCCTPVFDIRHELPLCMEHAMKAVSDPKQKNV